MKQKRFQIVMWVGMGLWFGGLIVMLAGLLYDEDMETTLGMVLLFVGIGMFVFGIILVCVAAALEKKRIKKELSELPPDVVPLIPGILACFKPEGLIVAPKSGVFSEETKCVPYSEVKVYHVNTFTSPRAKGKEAYFLCIPTDTLFLVSEEDAPDTVSVPTDGKVVESAQQYGIEIIEKLQAPAETRIRRRKFIWRQKGQLIRATCMMVVALAVCAGAVVLGVFLERSGSSTGWVSGVDGGIAAMFILSATRLCAVDHFDIYTDGIYIRTRGLGNLAKRFVPFVQIEGISRSRLGIVVSIGCEEFFYPDMDELWEYLTENYPDIISE